MSVWAFAAISLLLLLAASVSVIVLARRLHWHRGWLSLLICVVAQVVWQVHLLYEDLLEGPFAEARQYHAAAGLIMSLATLIWLKRWITSAHLDARVRQDLAGCESAWQLLFRRSSEATALLDAEYRFLEVNDQACGIFGYTREQLLGKTPVDFIHPEDLKALPLQRDEIAQGQMVTTIRRLRRGDGRYVHCEVRAVRMPDGRIIISFHDVSAHRSIQDALRNSLSMMSQAASLARIGYFTLDLQTNEVTASEEIYRLIQIEPGTPLSVADLLARTHPDDAAEVQRQLNRAIAEHHTMDVEYRAVLAGGEIRHLHALAKVTYDQFDVATRVLAAVQDITDRKYSEQVLRASEERFRRVFDSSPAGICTVGLDQRISSPNPAFCRILGFTAEELCGKPVLSLVHPEDIQRDQYLMETLPKVQQEEIRATKRLRKKDGSFVWVDLTAVTVRDSDGRPLHGLGLIQDMTSRRDAEFALATSEKRYRSLFNEMIQAIAVCELVFGPNGEPVDFRIIDVNPALLKMLNSPQESFVGRLGSEAAPRAYEQIKDKCFRVALSGISENLEYASSTYRKILEGTIFSPRKGTFAIAFMDVTERRNSEQALKESEERFRKLYMDAPAMMHSIDRDGRIVNVNKAWLRTLGYTDAEVLGRDSSDFMTEESRRATRESVRPRFFAGSSLDDIPFQFVRKDGQVVDTLLSGIPELGSDGQIIRGMAVLRDVTSQKRAELALAQSESKYRALVEATDTGFAILDDRGAVLDANPEYVRLTGRRQLKEILGQSVLDWTAPDKRSVNGEAVKRCLLEGVVRGFEVDYISPGGTVTPVEVNASTVHSDGPTRILALCRDISPRRQAEDERARLEEQLRLSQKLETVGILAAGIAHDFNNLLVPIIGYTELVTSSLHDRLICTEYLGEILKASYRAKELVSQILSFGREHPSEKISLSLSSLVKEVCKLLQTSLGPSIKVVQKIETSTSSVLADPSQIHQAIMNLCVNAAQAMPSGGTLTILLRDYAGSAANCPGCGLQIAGPVVHLAICDNGQGMAPDIRRRVFDPFFSTRLASQGTGLGLAVTHGIVTGHGGHICVQSEPEKGSNFHILLPVIAAGNDLPDPCSSAEARGSQSILLVDDSEEVAASMARTLDSLGYRTTALQDPTQALRLVADAPDRFDLVLTDFHLAGMDGDQLARELTHIKPGIRIIMTSACHGTFDPISLKERGISEVLIKPFPAQELHYAIQSALQPAGSVEPGVVSF